MLKKIKKLYAFSMFNHAYPLVRAGLKRPLQEEDIPKNPEWLNVHNIPEGANDLSLKGPWRFLFSLLPLYRPRIWILVGSVLVLWGLSALVPALIHSLISELSTTIEGQGSVMTALWLTLGFCFFHFLNSYVVQFYFYFLVSLEALGINIVNFRIYKKALSLSQKTLQSKKIGDIVNHMGADTYKIAEFHFIFAEMIFSIGLILVVAAMTAYYIGWSALAGIGVLFLLAPLCRLGTVKFIAYEEKIMAIRDERVNVMSQILNSIRVVKYLVWEKLAKEDVQKIRTREVASMRKKAVAQSLTQLLFLTAGSFALLASLGSYLWQGNALDAATIFAVIALFSKLQHPFEHLAWHLALLVESKVAAGRVIDFLNYEGKESESAESSAAHEITPLGLKVNQLNVRFDNEAVIKDWNLSFAPGEAVAIVGPIGGGKSTLLRALINELDYEGHIEWVGLNHRRKPSFSWVPQNAYILNASIAENICFGSDEDADKLTHAIHLARFEKDVDLLGYGVKTEIGEQGVNLSGGQKQRLSLARAVYQNPEVCLLDDPISAVDHQTGDIIMNRLVFGEWKDRLRIMVTHRLEHLQAFDRVLFVEDGEVVGNGRLSELLKNNTRFSEFYLQHLHEEEKSAEVESQTKESKGVKEEVRHQEENGVLTVAEDREDGHVKLSVYTDYLKAMAGNKPLSRALIYFGLFGSALLGAAFPVMQNYWVSVWNAVESGNIAKSSQLTQLLAGWFAGDTWQNFEVFAWFGIALIAFGFLRVFLWIYQAISAGVFYHDRALNATLKTKIRFFDTNPVGRILNRFSLDMDTVESGISQSFSQLIAASTSTLVMLGVILFIVPESILFLVPGLLGFYWLQKLYRPAARDLRRLMSITRSPRFAHFKETLEGLESIRAYRKQGWFWQKFYKTLEGNQEVFHSMIVINRWFSMRLPLITAVFNLFAVGFLVYISSRSFVEPGLVGLLLLISFRFSDYLNWAVRTFSDVESRLTSIERLKYYGALTPEPDIIRESNQEIPESWPERGEIVFENVKVRYAKNLPLVLKGVTHKIASQQKAGIIGTTGAGKSTIIQALFRLVDIAEGRILIDGVDIATVPLNRLRRAIAIIPQDPILNSGSLRSNIDRYNQHSDEEIENILSQVSLLSFVNKLPNGLETILSENGSNLSRGQRQLICLARALLNESKIVVMDEATASMDVETDRLIHQAIHRAFSGRTLLIIAHRLGTLSDCDQIIEMAQGRVKKVTQRGQVPTKKVPVPVPGRYLSPLSKISVTL